VKRRDFLKGAAVPAGMILGVDLSDGKETTAVGMPDRDGVYHVITFDEPITAMTEFRGKLIIATGQTVWFWDPPKGEWQKKP